MLVAGLTDSRTRLLTQFVRTEFDDRNTVAITDALASGNDSSVVFQSASGDDSGHGLIEAYREQAAELLSVPVHADETKADGSVPETRIQRGSDHRLRGSLLDRIDQGQADSTEITVHAHQSRQPGFRRRLFERIVV